MLNLIITSFQCIKVSQSYQSQICCVLSSFTILVLNVSAPLYQRLYLNTTLSIYMQSLE